MNFSEILELKKEMDDYKNKDGKWYVPLHDDAIDAITMAVKPEIPTLEVCLKNQVDTEGAKLMAGAACDCSKCKPSDFNIKWLYGQTMYKPESIGMIKTLSP